MQLSRWYSSIAFSLQAARSRLVLSEHPAMASADAAAPMMMRYLYLVIGELGEAGAQFLHQGQRKSLTFSSVTRWTFSGE